MGAFQLPDDVEGAAIGCLSYSALCLVANLILVWLIWVHRERTSYVAFIAYFTLLATVSSLVQQLYDYILWVDIMTWQFWYGKDNSGDAEVQYQNEIFGLKLALSYVRIACFMVESSLVFFFSLALAATVHGWWAKKPQALRKLSVVGRILPVSLAVISIVLLQLGFAHESFIAYMVIANAQFVISLFGACIFLVMILYKYLQTRRRLNTWTLDYGRNGKPPSTMTGSTGYTGKRSTMNDRRSRAFSGSQPSATFDNWLVIRLTIAFMTLCVFEWTNISPRFKNREKVLATMNDPGPDLSEHRAMSTVTGYLSGVSPSLLAFLVFGTTKAFQRKMYRTFVPAFIRRRRSNDDDDDDNLTSIHHLPVSTGNSSYARASTALYPQSPRTPKSSHFRTSSVPMPEAVVFAPGTPKTPALRHHHSESSLGSKYEPHTVAMGYMESSQPLLTSASRLLPPIHEPGHNWLDDETASISIRRSQIGIAISEPSSPACNSTAPWREPMSPPTAAAVTAAHHRPPSTALTFLREASDDDDSLRSARKRSSLRRKLPPLSIPVSRFSNNKNSNSAGGHSRRTSETGSITVIWSEGPIERAQQPTTRSPRAREQSRINRDRSGSARLDPSARAGRDYSSYVAPVRRESAAV